MIAIVFMALNFEGKGSGWTAWMVLTARLALRIWTSQRVVKKSTKSVPVAGENEC
jgi:hypothetical protein